jgi:hypothetical protein
MFTRGLGVVIKDILIRVKKMGRGSNYTGKWFCPGIISTIINQ